MAKRGNEKKGKILREETAQGILAVLFGALGVVLALAAFGKAGIVGEKAYALLTRFVGIGFFLLPILSLALSIGFLRALRSSFPKAKAAGAVVLFACGLGIIDLVFPTRGGGVGTAIGTFFSSLFGIYAALVILAAIFIIALLILCNASLPLSPLLELLSKIRRRKAQPKITGGVFEENGINNDETGVRKDETEEKEETDARGKEKREPPEKSSREEETGFIIARQKSDSMSRASAYIPPPLSLLEGDRGKPGVGDIKANANIIKRTLQNFGIEVEMDEISIGPAVTRYALKPAEGVKLSRIVALQNDLALALAAHPIRIEAPIPGKSLVGIEIPNHIKATVGLATMLGSFEFRTSEKPLLLSLGKDISGKAHFANLSKMPHLLIAGATGAGKSVTIHTLITSLLFRNSPDDLKLILIDPKRVELTLYNKIPHLLTHVITDAKKAILALKWAAKEMDRRYDILESESVRDIHSYHKNVLEPELQKAERRGKESEKDVNKLPERLPYIVIIIDELADIMSSFPRELEAAIVRLAQMSRATGIHLILSTQRPSVNIITGLIKANIPARIALQVSSQIDSRTILDTGGAEKLLGAGDMLFLSGEMSKPIRLQSAYVSEGEVKKLTTHLVKAYRDELPSELIMGEEEENGPLFDGALRDDDIDDDLYEAARAAVLEAGKASTSYLQRKLRIGYSRAARLMDMLEERQIIGPADGSKPRTVVGAAPAPQEGEENDMTAV